MSEPARRAAFLKGINLGKRRITNDELRVHVGSLGLDEVAIFRASGNIVFSDPERRSDGALAELIETGLERLLGYDITTFVRSGPELAAVSASEPFEAAVRERLKGKLQVIFLREDPAEQARSGALELGGAQDALVFGRAELFWLPASGVSDSKLDFKALERLLGPATVRTMGTVEQITARHFAT